MSEKDRDKDSSGDDPLNNLFGMLFGAGGAQGGAQGQFPAGGIPIDANMLSSFLGQIQGLMGHSRGAGDVAQQTAASKVPTPDPIVTEEVSRATHDAFRLAELWLERVTDFTTTNEPQSLTRKDWATRSVDGWVEIAQPIQANMSRTFTESMSDQIPEEMRPFMSSMSSMMTNMSASLFGAQIGEALGTLSGSVLTGTDYNLPILDAPALIESNISGAAAELDLDHTQLRIFVACVELAKRALFASTPWLAGHIRTAFAKYASNVEVDSSNIHDMMGNIDPQNLHEATEELRNGMFKPVSTEEGEQAKESLTRIVSTVAGWADVVAYNACEALEQRDEIREALRRRTTTTSDSENALSQLIGLDLTPTRLRDAAALFTYLESSEGAQARDAVFSHPDALPTNADLDDPLGYSERHSEQAQTEDDMDEALRRLLEEES